MTAPAARRALRPILAGAMALLSAVTLADGACAGSTWDGLRPELYGARAVMPGAGVVSIEAPSRPDDQRAVPISVEARLKGGATIRAVHIIVDENPSPLAAQFRFPVPRDHVALSMKFRLNAETDVRAVVETSDGELYMAARHVKYAGGQAACSAPPAGDPAEIAANMGKMQLAEVLAKASAAGQSQIERKVRLDISHPNHTGMVLDQQTLLYIPLRMMEKVEIRQGDEAILEMTGSITVAQDPSLTFDYRMNGAEQLSVTARDTNGEAWQRSFPIAPGT